MIQLLNGETYLQGEINTLSESDNFYYGHLQKHALSSSILRNVYEDMNKQLEYLKKASIGKERDAEPLILGKLAHWCWLEPDKFYKKHFIDAPRINSPEYIEAEKKFGRENVFKDKYRGLVEWWCRKLDNNEVVRDIRKDADVEVPMIGMIDVDEISYPVRGKADLIKGDTIYDLKTGIVSPKDFEWKIKNMHYDLQAYIYLELFKDQGINNFKFIYINKNNRSMGLIDMPEEVIARGGRKFKVAVQLYMENFYNKDLDQIEYALDQYLYFGEAK